MAAGTTEGKYKQDSGSASWTPFLGKGFCKTSGCLLAGAVLNYLEIQTSPQPAQGLQ